MVISPKENDNFTNATFLVPTLGNQETRCSDPSAWPANHSKWLTDWFEPGLDREDDAQHNLPNRRCHDNYVQHSPHPIFREHHAAQACPKGECKADCACPNLTTQKKLGGPVVSEAEGMRKCSLSNPKCLQQLIRKAMASHCLHNTSGIVNAAFE